MFTFWFWLSGIASICIVAAGTFGSNEVSKANLLRCGLKIAIDSGWSDKAKEPEPVLAPAVDEEAERLAREKAEAERLAAEQAAEQIAKEEEVREHISEINVYFANDALEPTISEQERALLEQLCESRGDKEPVVPNDSRANRAKNRRANIRIE